MHAARRAEWASRLARLPPLLLAAVALQQIWLARTAELSPWLGGGFGMFASTDSAAQRHLHAWVIRPGSRRELEVPEALREELRRALALPTEARLRALAQQLAEREAEEAADYEGPAEAIELQVFRTRYDPETLAPEGELLRSTTLRLGAH
jgi:hypothetical protein